VFDISKIIPKSLAVLLWRIPLPKFLKNFIIWHTNHHFLVAVLGIVVNDRGEILLLRHTYRDEPWGIPGGWMNYEQPWDGLKREVYEETGLRISIDKVVKASYTSDPHRIDILMCGRFINGEFRPSAEVSEYGFFKVGQWPVGMPNKQKVLIEQVISMQNEI